LVGSRGQVIGVDLNNDMLGLARSHQKDVAARIGYDNVQFLRGRIQDLALDLDRLRQEMQTIDWRHADSTSVLMDLQNRLRSRTPMIADASVDCVVSNCVLNLVDPHDRKQLFAEIFRVLKPGGRAAISDIVSDEDVPVEMQNDSQLWSGCISGAWREDLFVEEFIRCGFQGVRIDKRQAEPWRTVQGIEFRSCTVLAFKPFSDVCLERNQAVIYRGPFSSVCDDDGHTFVRGERTAVCEKTYQLLSEQSFNGCFCFIEPYEVVPRESAGMFDCTRDRKRHPRESKGTDQTVKQQPEQECCGGSCC
jgi:SAM-dependent methyltransferase